MTSEETSADPNRQSIVRELHELIAALDRRLPQVERVGETAIAQAAAVLRGEASRRIAMLQHEADADAIASWLDPTQATADTQRRTKRESNGAE